MVLISQRVNSTVWVEDSLIMGREILLVEKWVGKYYLYIQG